MLVLIQCKWLVFYISSYSSYTIFKIVIPWKDSKVNTTCISYEKSNNQKSSIETIFQVLLDNFQEIFPKPNIDTPITKILKRWYWESSYYTSWYRNIDIKNIDPTNHIQPKSPQFHIEPALQPINFNLSNFYFNFLYGAMSFSLQGNYL